MSCSVVERGHVGERLLLFAVVFVWLVDRLLRICRLTPEGVVVVCLLHRSGLGYYKSVAAEMVLYVVVVRRGCSGHGYVSLVREDHLQGAV